jgi:hypothetical protein
VRATPFALFLVAAAVLVLATGQALTTAAPINLAIDFDSDNGVGGVRTGVPVVTQPGFLSWDASVFLPNAPLPRPFYQLVTQGVTFDVWFRRPSTPGSIVTPQSYGSRVRSGGGPLDDLLQDFIFAEGDSGNFIYLIARGLPVGSYRMTTWHFDSPLASAPDGPNHMQIEVGDQQPGGFAAATSVVVDDFPLGLAPQVFEFQVTSPNVVKEFVFRSDDASAAHRTRLNGFTLVSVPEPGTLLALLTALPLMLRRRHRAN